MFWFIFVKDSLLLTHQHEIPRGDRCPIMVQPWHTILHLPKLGNEECRSVCLDSFRENESFLLKTLRESFYLLPSEHYNMAGKAAELHYWDSNSKFCGMCGGPMKFHTEISKRCTHCGKEVWPQIAVAIIVAITRNDGKELLMVKAKNFKRDYYGLVAGFVETGETLEECVIREVKEETNLSITNIKYFNSQPWPYPNGLMVGFTAEYASGEIKLQESELKAGGWFTKDNFPNIPGKVSLTRQLIDNWLDSQQREND